MRYEIMMKNLLKKAKVEKKVEGVISRILPSWVPFTPFFAQMEVTNRCNLNCVMCPRAKLMKGHTTTNLSPTNFQFFLKQFPLVHRVDLQGLGEPLLNPDLEEMIQWCTNHNIETSFVTNGLLLDSGRIKSLLNAGLSRITVSLDSMDPDIYANIRSGANVGKVTTNIENLIAFRKQNNHSKPHIGLMAIAMKDTVKGIPALIQAAAELGVDSLTVKGLNTMITSDLPKDLRGSLQRISRDATYHTSMEVIIASGVIRGRLRCRWPWLATYITVEGDVTPCCNCPDKEMVKLGNLFDVPFSAIWNSSPYREFRHKLRNGVPQVCRSCSDY